MVKDHFDHKKHLAMETTFGADLLVCTTVSGFTPPLSTKTALAAPKSGTLYGLSLLLLNDSTGTAQKSRFLSFCWQWYPLSPGGGGTRSRKIRVCETGPSDPLPPSFRNSLKNTPPSIYSVAGNVWIFRPPSIINQIFLSNPLEINIKIHKFSDPFPIMALFWCPSGLGLIFRTPSIQLFWFFVYPFHSWICE